MNAQTLVTDYCPAAVDREIERERRRGKRVSKREARTIHALLRGRRNGH